MRTKTPEQSEKMLDAAERLFGRLRFHEVRMEDIAAEAKVGKGTLYRYFLDKEELYLALISRSSRELLAIIEDGVSQAKNPRTQLHAIVTAMFGYFESRPHLGPLIQRSEVAHAGESPWQPTRDAVAARIVEILNDASANGEFQVRDPLMAAHLLLGGLRGIFLFGSKPRSRDLPARIVECFLHGAAH